MKKRPGHLKERNHFDGKDMILLVVTMLIIYGIFTWIFSDYTPNNYPGTPGATNPPGVETSIENNSAESSEK